MTLATTVAVVAGASVGGHVAAAAAGAGAAAAAAARDVSQLVARARAPD